MEFNKFATNVERSFNLAACFPFVAIGTSYVRASAAAIQTTVSFTIGCVGLLAQIVDSDPKWKQMTKGAVEHWIHGTLNGFRAAGELTVAQTIIGSPILLLPQLILNQFRPLIGYSEKTPEKRNKTRSSLRKMNNLAPKCQIFMVESLIQSVNQQKRASRSHA